MANTPRLGLQNLVANQSSAELVYNELLRILDIVSHTSVVNMTTTAPPTATSSGNLYVIGGTPSGQWDTDGALENWIAQDYLNNTWKYLEPYIGMIIFNIADSKYYRFDGASWNTLEFGGNIGNAILQGYSEVENSITTQVLPTTTDIDLNLGNFFTITLDQDIELTFTNEPSNDGNIHPITIEVTQDGIGSHDITWPASVKWSGGIAPILSPDPNAVDVVSGYCYNRGAGVVYRLDRAMEDSK